MTGVRDAIFGRRSVKRFTPREVSRGEIEALIAAAPASNIPAQGPGKAAIASAYPLASEAGHQDFGERVIQAMSGTPAAIPAAAAGPFCRDHRLGGLQCGVHMRIPRDGGQYGGIMDPAARAGLRMARPLRRGKRHQGGDGN